MRVFNHRGKLLSLAMLGASLGAGLLNGGVAGATGPLTVSVLPSNVVLTSVPAAAQANASYVAYIQNAQVGEKVSITDHSGCTQDNTSLTGVVTDASGRAEIPVSLSGCSTLVPSPANITVDATGTLSGIAHTQYNLLSARP